MGLREEKKELCRQAILDEAMHLFEVDGFSATTVERIAKAAGVSTPTVFNYFGTKQDILLELVNRADRTAISDTRVRLSDFDNAVDALCYLQAAIMKRELESLPISIWREVMSLGSVGSLAPGLRLQEERLAEEIAEVLRELQSAGLLSAKLDTAFVATFLNDYCAGLFARFVLEDNSSYEAHLLQVRRVAELVFNGMKP